MQDAVQEAKRRAAERAVTYVKSGMVVGLGTGSTAYYAIKLLGECCSKGLDIQGVPTSLATQSLAEALGIPIQTEFDRIDVSIDGADEVDDCGNLIKGGGGALTREKIVASASRYRIIVCDDSKLKPYLGQFPLPVEVLPFGWHCAAAALEKLGCTLTMRALENSTYITDNGNYVLNCSFNKIPAPEELSTRINMIPGVIENGLFCGLTERVILAGLDGSVREIGFG